MGPQDYIRPVPYVVTNLTLALIPVGLAFVATALLRRKYRLGEFARRALIVVSLILWAVFLPNTCYLLTEWRHYIDGIQNGYLTLSVPYDHVSVLRMLLSTGFYIFYSGAGLLAFFLSVWPIDRLVGETRPRLALALRLAVFALCGLGVYLGLVCRFNSWDLVNPDKLPYLIHKTFVSVQHWFVLGLMAVFSGVLWALYEGFTIWMEGWRLRMTRAS